MIVRIAPMVGLLFSMGAVSASAAPPSNRAAAAVERFQQAHPDAGLSIREGRIEQIHSPAFGVAPSPEQAADDLLRAHSEMFGVRSDDLVYARSVQLMHGKFTAVYYDQHFGGVEVHRAGVTVLVRHDVGNGIVLISADLHDLLDARIAPPAAAGGLGAARVQSDYPDFAFTAPELIVYPHGGHPVHAFRFIGGNDSLTDPRKYEFIVDASNDRGEVLAMESLIYDTGVEGHVSGWASQGQGADICAPDGLEAMPYARVSVEGGASAFADANGDFVVPNDGDDPVIVQSPVRGRYFRVINHAGSDALLEREVVPPGPVDFEHDPSREEFTRAEVNAYIEANVVRDYVLRYSPDYPVIRGQTDFPLNVNVDGQCNAFYSGSSITFFRAGGQCPNMAYGGVVHHEYGHHLVAVGGSGQGQYGEGAGDTMSVVIFDDPRLAPGFGGDCNRGLRSAENDLQYPCAGEIHFCGQLIAGCVWDTRNELVVTEPDEYRDVISSLWINSIPLHRGNLITPLIVTQWLILDDDDGDFSNGTPHYREISTGFGRHNMHGPSVTARPASFEVTHGVLRTGDVESLMRNDDLYVDIAARPPVVVADPSVGIEITGTSFERNPRWMELRVETAATATPVRQTVELLNAASQTWELLDEREAPSQDTTVIEFVPSRGADYIDQQTGEITSRIRFFDRGVTFPAWSARIDRIYWVVGSR
jgi:hypothetical protein